MKKSGNSCLHANPVLRLPRGDGRRTTWIALVPLLIVLLLSCSGPARYSGCGALSDAGRDDVYPRYRVDLPMMDFGEHSSLRCNITELPEPEHTGFQPRLVLLVAGESPTIGDTRRVSELLAAAGVRVEVALISPSGESTLSGSPGAGLSGSFVQGEYFLYFSEENEWAAKELRGSTLTVKLAAEAPDLLADVEIAPSIVGGGRRL